MSAEFLNLIKPDINLILPNLGKAKYLSSIGLESGFHHILMTENYIETGNMNFRKCS